LIAENRITLKSHWRNLFEQGKGEGKSRRKERVLDSQEDEEKEISRR